MKQASLTHLRGHTNYFHRVLTRKKVKIFHVFLSHNFIFIYKYWKSIFNGDVKAKIVKGSYPSTKFFGSIFFVTHSAWMTTFFEAKRIEAPLKFTLVGFIPIDVNSCYLSVVRLGDGMATDCSCASLLRSRTKRGWLMRTKQRSASVKMGPFAHRGWAEWELFLGRCGVSPIKEVKRTPEETSPIPLDVLNRDRANIDHWRI